MSTDDDLVRRALAGLPRPSGSYQELERLRPSMRRARYRRRAALGATAAVFVLGGGAGVLALTAGEPTRTLRTSTSLEAPAPPMPAPSTSAASAPPAVPTPSTAPTPSTEPTSSAAPTTVLAPPSTVTIDDPPDAGAPPVATPARVPPTIASTPAPVPPPAEPAPPSTPPPTVPPTPPLTVPPPTSSQTISSACGTVIVSVDDDVVRISSLLPAPEFEPYVATDGPSSIEVVFRGTAGTCEVHAELEDGKLDVEVNDLERDD